MIDPARYGVSFSLKQCRAFGLDAHATLDWLLAVGLRRFRLMSYWDEHEPQPGRYDFRELDWQIEVVRKAGGVVSLALGVKQPRWPEYHWPTWAWEASKVARDKALLAYVGETVIRYRDNPTIISWQLENEALLKGFGRNIEIDRRRLRSEYQLVKQLDPTRPITMSTSNGWGMPVRSPRPDRVGFSFYPVMYKKGTYHKTIQKSWLHRLRRSCIRILLGKPVFIHELQCEPWGPEPIWKMSREEQDKSMGLSQITHNITAAQKVKIYPIDLWGAEWWFWRHQHGDPSIYNAVQQNIST